MERQHEHDLTGKVVIVTGAIRGVGRQAGILFTARGARVVLAARTVEPD
jgi:NAD(P)-dependent dehydrogenase (short-subunit alcohol dehydrogenase family)